MKLEDTYLNLGGDWVKVDYFYPAEMTLVANNTNYYVENATPGDIWPKLKTLKSMTILEKIFIVGTK